MGLVPSKKEKIQEEIRKIKSLKGVKRWEHIWEYYKLFIVGFLILLLVGVSNIVNSIVDPPPTLVLNVAWAHMPQRIEVLEALADELTESVTETSRNEEILVLAFTETGEPQLDAHLHMRFAAMITAADLDILIATRETILEYAAEGMLMDISSWLPRGMDGLVQVEGARGVSPVFGVSILNSRILEEAEFFMSEDCLPPYVAVIINSERLEKARLAIEALLE